MNRNDPMRISQAQLIISLALWMLWILVALLIFFRQNNIILRQIKLWDLQNNINLITQELSRAELQSNEISHMINDNLKEKKDPDFLDKLNNQHDNINKTIEKMLDLRNKAMDIYNKELQK